MDGRFLLLLRSAACDEECESVGFVGFRDLLGSWIYWVRDFLVSEICRF